MRRDTKEVLSIALVGLVLAGLIYGKESKRNKYPEITQTNNTETMPKDYKIIDSWYDVQLVSASINEETKEYYIPEDLEGFHLFNDKCYRVSLVTLFEYPAKELVVDGKTYYTAPYGVTLEGDKVICKIGKPLEYEEAKEVLIEQGYLSIDKVKRLEK